MLCKACGPLDSISLSGCGRKTFQLDARFKELVAALDNLGLNPTSMYHHAAAGREVPENNDVADELRPYRPLDASRVKLTGTGEWNCEDYLSDLLFMAFVEPAINTFDVIPPEGLYPDVADADCRQIEELCRVWDANGLLRLIPVELGPEPADMHLHTRVFGNFKNKLADRQIGDRRGRNFVEGRISPGPSHEIPSATALLQLEARRFHEVLVGAIADRRDFYHQFHVTYERAATNTVYPAFCLGDFKHTAAYSAFVQTFAKQRARPREEVGDFLGMPRPLLIGVSDDRPVYAAFGALFQGDHLGVEFACCAHAQMLEEAGCHCAMNRLCAHHAILHNSPVTGLVIDDFFVVSAEDRPSARGSDFLGKSKSSEVLEQAKAAYKREGIIGSDDKEVQNAWKFKVIGAEVNSCTELVDKGLVSLGAPGDKRLGLCMLSALIANLPYTTDALHASLVGSWISVLLYRRPMMSHINKLFKVVSSPEDAGSTPKLHVLPRGAAEELLVLACLGPLAASNLAAPFSDRVYASDASTRKGGLVVATITPDLSKMLWRTSNKKVKNLALQSRTASLHRIHDASFEELEEEDDQGPDTDVHRPIGLSFDFIELCGGAGVVTKQMILLGFVCAPVFDISYSRRYDVTNRKVFAWIAFMCESGRLRSFLAAPPCTTFSPAAHPCLRSYKQPLGFDRRHPRVLQGNDLAFSCLGTMLVARRTRTPGMLETTRRSKLRWTPQWIGMKRLGADEIHLASCEYGSPHQKEFALLTVSMNAKSLAKKCSRQHVHVRVQGKYTKASATYCEGLARAIAQVFARHLRKRAGLETECHNTSAGLEDALSNEVLRGADWEEISSWNWKGSSHINILEVAAALRAYEKEALRGGDLRFVEMVDSNVALCSLVRGRSSSDAWRPLLKRASTISVAYGLYQAGRFAPTRLNPADHPTRDTKIPPPLASVLDGLDLNELRWISMLSGLRRWEANWIRLSLLLCPSWISFFACPDSSRRYGQSSFHPSSFMDFDSTLGFPGEGPCPYWLVVWILAPLDFWGVVAVARRHGDALRREQRQGIELPEGRRVTELTTSVRAQLMSAFSGWLRVSGLAYNDMFQGNPPDLDKINSVLCQYGRYLFCRR